MTTWLNWYQKGKTSLDLNEATDNGGLGWQWHQLDRMQTICTSLQTDNHTNTSSLNVYRLANRLALFLMPKQQCQSTESIAVSKCMSLELYMYRVFLPFFSVFSLLLPFLYTRLNGTLSGTPG